MTRPVVSWSLRTRIPFTHAWRARREWRKWADAAQELIEDAFPWWPPFSPATLSTARDPEAIVLMGQQLAATLKAVEAYGRTEGDAGAALAVLLEHAPVVTQEAPVA